MDRHYKCECGKSFWTRKGLDDHCRTKGGGHSLKSEQGKTISTLEYLLEKSAKDAMSDDAASFCDDYVR